MLDARSGCFGPYLFAVLVSNYVSFGRAGVGTQDDPVLKQTADDCCPGTGRLGKRDPAICQEIVSVQSWRAYRLRRREQKLT